MDKPQSNHEKRILPSERKLVVEYDPEWDILVLSNGKSASFGAPVAEDLVVFYDKAEGCEEPHIVTLEGAAKLLRPYLFPDT